MEKKRIGNIMMATPSRLDALPKIGFGRTFTAGRGANTPGLGASIDDILNRINFEPPAMPDIESVRWSLDGPQLDVSIAENFGAEIDPFGAGKGAALGTGEIVTSMAAPGQTQVPMVVCAIGVHFIPEPYACSVPCNAWGPKTSAAVGKPLSPDSLTIADAAQTTGGIGLVAGNGGGTMRPAYIDYGQWLNNAFRYMAKAYNLSWTIGQHMTLIDTSLQNVAYMPGGAQPASAGNINLNVSRIVRGVNDYYASVGTAPTYTALKFDVTRIGSFAGGNGAFHPDRSNEFVEAAYGGVALQTLLQANKAWYPLTQPYILKGGIPLGLSLREVDETGGNMMRAALSLTGNATTATGATFPPSFQDDFYINAGTTLTGAAGGASPISAERTLDGGNIAFTVYSERVQFKGGRGDIVMSIKGFPLTDDFYTLLQNDQAARAQVIQDCGVRFAQTSSQ